MTKKQNSDYQRRSAIFVAAYEMRRIILLQYRKWFLVMHTIMVDVFSFEKKINQLSIEYFKGFFLNSIAQQQFNKLKHYAKCGFRINVLQIQTSMAGLFYALKT